MACEDSFEFFQPNLVASSFSAFCDMKKNGELSDVTIRIQNQVFVAHRIILAAAIPYFRTIFTSKVAESQEKEITVKELDPNALESLIDFAYTSKLKITVENVHSLLVASSFLHVTEVRNKCCEFLSKRLDPNNVVNVRTVADSLNCLNLVQEVDIYIRKNFEAFCQTKEFLNLSFPFLNDLIRKDDLQVSSEERVFDSVMSWVKTDTERHKMLPDLLNGVRMTFLTPQFLVNNVSKEKLIMDSVPCRNLLDEAKHYHLLPEQRTFGCSFTVSERCYDRCAECGIYLFCCNKASGLTIFKYIEGTGQWDTILNDKSRSDVRHVLAVGKKIYVFQMDTFEAFDPGTLAWTPRTKFPSNYLKSTSFKRTVSCGGKILWLAYPNHVHVGICFDPEQNQWLSYAHHKLHMFDCNQLVPSGKVIYLFGLINRGNSDGHQIQAYDLETETVSCVPQMKNKRKYFGSVVLDETVYVCGGISTPQNEWANGNLPASTILNSTETYRLSQGWRNVSSMNTQRSNFTLLTYDKKLYAFGGTSNPRDGVECYDPATDKWTFAGNFVVGQYDFIKAVAISAEKN